MFRLWFFSSNFFDKSFSYHLLSIRCNQLHISMLFLYGPPIPLLYRSIWTGEKPRLWVFYRPKMVDASLSQFVSLCKLLKLFWQLSYDLASGGFHIIHPSYRYAVQNIHKICQVHLANERLSGRSKFEWTAKVGFVKRFGEHKSMHGRFPDTKRDNRVRWRWVELHFGPFKCIDNYIHVWCK